MMMMMWWTIINAQYGYMYILQTWPVHSVPARPRTLWRQTRRATVLQKIQKEYPASVCPCVCGVLLTWRCIQRVVNIVGQPSRKPPVIGTILEEEKILFLFFANKHIFFLQFGEQLTKWMRSPWRLPWEASSREKNDAQRSSPSTSWHSGRCDRRTLIWEKVGLVGDHHRNCTAVDLNKPFCA